MIYSPPPPPFKAETTYQLQLSVIRILSSDITSPLLIAIAGNVCPCGRPSTFILHLITLQKLMRHRMYIWYGTRRCPTRNSCIPTCLLCYCYLSSIATYITITSETLKLYQINRLFAQCMHYMMIKIWLIRDYRDVIA